MIRETGDCELQSTHRLKQEIFLFCVIKDYPEESLSIILNRCQHLLKEMNFLPSQVKDMKPHKVLCLKSPLKLYLKPCNHVI